MPSGVYERKQRVAKVAIHCSVCGTERLVLPSYAGMVSGKFCSKKCAGIARSAKISFACAHCGAAGQRKPVHMREKNYCSKACVSASRRKPNAKWKDPEQIKQYLREYGDRNRARLNELSRIRSRGYRDKKNENQRKRRSLGPRPRDMGRKVWADLLAIFGNRCLCCGAEARLEADHVKSVAEGGTNALDNFQSLCRTCNASKGAAHFDYRTKEQRAAVSSYMLALYPAVRIVEV